MNGNFYDYKKISEVREAKVKQDKLAEKLGVSPITLSRLENGKNASYELIIQVCKELEIDSKEIFYSSNSVSLAA